MKRKTRHQRAEVRMDLVKRTLQDLPLQRLLFRKCRRSRLGQVSSRTLRLRPEMK